MGPSQIDISEDLQEIYNTCAKIMKIYGYTRSQLFC